jgi:hypothetical protein
VGNRHLLIEEEDKWGMKDYFGKQEDEGLVVKSIIRYRLVDFNIHEHFTRVVDSALKAVTINSPKELEKEPELLY